VTITLSLVSLLALAGSTRNLTRSCRRLWMCRNRKCNHENVDVNVDVYSRQGNYVCEKCNAPKEMPEFRLHDKVSFLYRSRHGTVWYDGVIAELGICAEDRHKRQYHTHKIRARLNTGRTAEGQGIFFVAPNNIRLRSHGSVIDMPSARIFLRPHPPSDAGQKKKESDLYFKRGSGKFKEGQQVQAFYHPLGSEGVWYEATVDRYDLTRPNKIHLLWDHGKAGFVHVDNVKGHCDCVCSKLEETLKDGEHLILATDKTFPSCDYENPCRFVPIPRPFEPVLPDPVNRLILEMACQYESEAETMMSDHELRNYIDACGATLTPKPDPVPESSSIDRSASTVPEENDSSSDEVWGGTVG